MSALLVLAACGSSMPLPTRDAGADASTDASSFDCATALSQLQSLRQNAAACSPGDSCAATISDFCCPIYVVSSASDGAQAYRQAYDRYRAAGCPGTLCSAKPCALPSSCVAGECAQP